MEFCTSLRYMREGRHFLADDAGPLLPVAAVQRTAAFSKSTDLSLPQGGDRRPQRYRPRLAVVVEGDDDRFVLGNRAYRAVPAQALMGADARVPGRQGAGVAGDPAGRLRFCPAGGDPRGAAGVV